MSQANGNPSQFLPRRADYDAPQSFDAQFWPVIIGLCTLSAFSAGAMVTLLNGAALWISLMVIPVVFFALLLILGFVDNRKFRRSLQLGLLLSLAIHLLFIVFASRVFIFGDQLVENSHEQRQTIKPPKVLRISSQQTVKPWEELNELPMPRPEEQIPEREQLPTTTEVEPQPVEINKTEPTETPKIVERKTPAETVPKQGKSLSETQRSVTNAQPEASTRAETSRASAASSSKENRTAEVSKTRETKVEVTRENQPTTSQAVRSQNNREVTKGTPETRVTRQNRRQPSSPSVSQNSRPTRRQRNTSEAVPQTTEVAVNSTPQRSNTASRSAESSPSRTSEISRTSPSQSSVSRSESQPQNQPSATVTESRPQRRQMTSTTPNQTPAVSQSNRRSNNSAAPTMANVTANTNTAETASSQSQSLEISAPQFSVNRSNQGTAGVGRSRNVARATGSRQSSARIPSQAARRESQQSTEMPSESFTPSQASRSPGRVASQSEPSSTMMAQNSPSASLSASRNLQQYTESASASLNNSSTSEHRDQVSADKGQAQADFGAERIVTESRISRVEGGGQPDVSMQRVENHSRRSELADGQMPSVETRAESGNYVAGNESANSSADSAISDAATDLSGRESDHAASSAERATTGQIREAGAGETASADARSMRRNDASPDTSEDGTRFATSGREQSDEGELPTANTLVEVDSNPSSGQSRRSDDGVGEPTLTANRNSNSGEVNVGMSEAEVRSSPGGSTTAEVGERRSSNTGQNPSLESSAVGSTPTRSQRTGESDLAVDTSVENSIGKGVANTEPAEGADVNSSINRMTTAKRQSQDGMSLDINAPVGPAGLDQRFEVNPGINSRRASTTSPDLLPTPKSRFVRKDAGGTPAVNPDAVISNQAFRSRRQSNRSVAPETEEAIELGLAFLARHQASDGSWNLGQFDVDHPERALQFHSDSAATGLALLAFQGAGYNHREFKYSKQVAKAVQWLVDNQKPNGSLFVESDHAQTNEFCRFYSHGIAALALTEAYGMTQDPALREPAQMALDYIEQTQHGSLGGWRYVPGRSSDTSVTGWMVMALQSGRLAGLDVKDSTLDGVKSWLSVARDVRGEHLFRYNPHAVDDEKTVRSHGRIPTPCMTSVGLLMQIYLNWDRNDTRLQAGADYLLQNLPSDSTENQRDTYYWYYATQVLRHVGGDRWEKWHAALHPLLVKTQIREGDMSGSWHPYEPVPDTWGRKGGGRLYVTTMNLLSLEVDYRLLPLYDETAK